MCQCVTVQNMLLKANWKLHYSSALALFAKNSITSLESMANNKASGGDGGDGIPFELLKILKDDAVKVLHSLCQEVWKTQQWPEDWKRSVYIPIPKKGSAKECPN